MLQKGVICLIVCCLCKILSAQPRPALIPYFDGSTWGYADTNGKLRLPPQWAEARPFIGNRAIVAFQKGVAYPKSDLYGIIDEEGRYIIPRSAGWLGSWNGWANTPLNAVDSNGRWGLLDTNGALLVPYEWAGSTNPLPKPLLDSYKVVIKDGLFGVINRNGAIVIPPKWGNIFSYENLAEVSAFHVADPDNSGGYNGNGVVDKHNRLLVPPRYHDISFMRLATGPVFRVTQAVQNQPPQGNTRNSLQARWLEYPTGRLLPSSFGEAKQVYEFPEPQGYISFYNQFGGGLRGLMDSARNILIPCCSVSRVTADTIYLDNTVDNGKDSTVTTRTYLHARSLKPYGAPLVKIYWREPDRDYNSYHHPSPSGNYGTEEPPTIKIDDWIAVTHFYKDSMLYTVSRKVSDQYGRSHLFVEGFNYRNNKTVGEHYYAVVDSNLAFLVRPTLHVIKAYNPVDLIVTVYSYFNGTAGYCLMSPEGQILMAPQQTELFGGFRWQGKLYAYSKKWPPHSDASAKSSTLISMSLLDSAGVPVAAFAGLNIIPDARSENQNQPLPSWGITVKDTNGLAAFMRPDGTSPYPKISFKYSVLSAQGNHWFITRTPDGTSGILIDSLGRPVLKDIYDVSLAPARHNENSASPIPRLYWVQGRDRSLKKTVVRFYLDDMGIAYYYGAR